MQIEYTIDQLFHEMYDKVFRVYDIFKDFFGEEYTDLQMVHSGEQFKNYARLYADNGVIDEEGKLKIDEGMKRRMIVDAGYPYILVYWPEVTVTNEFGKSIEIQDLFAKIMLNLNGNIPMESNGFKLNRSTYTTEQFASDYMHSHISHIPKSRFTEFQMPCLGSGPISSTILTLKTSDAEEMWMLFCQELALYVTVESIRGIPYHRLEQVSARNGSLIYLNLEKYVRIRTPYILRSFSTDDIMDFIKYYMMNGNMKFGFDRDRYVLGMDAYSYMIDVSNCFIDYYNRYFARSRNLNSIKRLENLFRNKILENIIVTDRKFYRPTHGYSTDFSRYSNALVCNFKGNEKRIRITGSAGSDMYMAVLLSEDTAAFILEIILNILNSSFTNESNNTAGEETAPVNKERFYL